MFYVYRLNEMADPQRCLTPHNDHRISSSPDFTLQAFFKLIKQIGWDSTWTGVIYQFALPAPPLMLECCAIRETMNGRWFLGAPVPLTYLDDMIDYDARTDSQEVKRATAAILKVETPQQPATKLTRQWQRNSKGTITASINYLNVCIMRSNYSDGYYGIIFSATNQKLKTRVFPNIQDVQDELEQNFNEIVNAWRHDSDEDDGTIFIT